jgi:WD40 repeat protein
VKTVTDLGWVLMASKFEVLPRLTIARMIGRLRAEVCSTGCINALDWSSDGTTLASGSDDTRCAFLCYSCLKIRADQL